jgi:glutaredoxin
MTGAPLPDLIVYSRPGCHLCEETRTLLERLLAERAADGAPVPALVERDIEADAELHRAMVNTIPVIEVGGHRLELAIGPGAIRRFIAAAYDAPDGGA